MMRFNKINAYLQRRFYGSSVRFHLMKEHEGKCYYAKPIEWVEHEEGRLFDEAFSMDMQECQELMDELWVLGLRPSEGTGSAGSLAATQKHLDDMRKIVFHKLGIK